MRFASALCLTAPLALALAACGNYSNEDIAFLEALPNASALSVTVPTTPSGALSSDARYHDYTVGVADVLNAWLTIILDTIDEIQTLSPTARTADSRTWGPFDDHSNPGYEIQVTITQEPSGDFDFVCGERLKGSGATYTPIITGDFFTQSAHQGHGTVQFLTSADASLGIDAGTGGLTGINVVYANDQVPRIITTIASGVDLVTHVPSSLTYAFQEQSDTSGELVFDLQGDFTDAGQTEDLHLVTVWLANGAGRADGDVSGGVFNELLGDGGSDRITQCWDTQFVEAYFESAYVTSDDDGGLQEGPLLCDALSGHLGGCLVGSAASCALPAAGP